MDELDGLLGEQIEYYRARGVELDQAYLHRPDLRSPGSLLDELPVAGDVLELACGTGQWTRALVDRGHPVTAIDAAPEMLAVARERVAGERVAGEWPAQEPMARDRVTGTPVEFIEADVFRWRPARRYDTVFFAFWLSHVPPARFAAFWDLVAAALRPGGRACFVDSGPAEREGEDLLAGQPAPAVRRRLPDGSVHRVVKVFLDPGELARTLEPLGWAARIRPLGKLVIGAAERVAPRDTTSEKEDVRK